MTLTKLTFLILNLNHLVDRGYHEGVSLDEVKQRIKSGDVLDWLGEKFKNHIDMSLYTHRESHNRAARAEITRGLQALLGRYAREVHRKWGVQNNGICLLIAWTTELVQQRAWRDLDEGVKNGCPSSTTRAGCARPTKTGRSKCSASGLTPASVGERGCHAGSAIRVIHRTCRRVSR